jgi:hypothetical protein
VTVTVTMTKVTHLAKTTGRSPLRAQQLYTVSNAGW